jgi:hypothetical protein
MIVYILLGLITISSSLSNYKLCINCKYFFYSNDLSSGKCSLFKQIEDPNEKEKKLINFLVSGVLKEDTNSLSYLDCVIARKYDNICGKEGKKYEKNNLFFFNSNANIIE